MSQLTDSIDRRNFLGAAGATLALGSAACASEATEHPVVKVPRATSGDFVSEPAWEEKLTLTAGPQKGDLIGSDEKVIQAAVDYLSRLGGGSVCVGK